MKIPLIVTNVSRAFSDLIYNMDMDVQYPELKYISLSRVSSLILKHFNKLMHMEKMFYYSHIIQAHWVMHVLCVRI